MSAFVFVSVSLCMSVGIGKFLASYFKQKVINFKQLNTVARWLVNARRPCLVQFYPQVCAQKIVNTICLECLHFID